MREACYTRTGHHSSTTGEWRDGKGLIAALFLHHISRDGDPQLHVHIPIANLVQRADGADDTWRSLDGRQMYKMRLSVAAAARPGNGITPDQPRIRDGPAGRRERRRGRRGQQRRHGPVLLPEPGHHPRTSQAHRPVHQGQGPPAVEADHMAARPASRPEHPAHQGSGPADGRRSHRPATNRPKPNGWPDGNGRSPGRNYRPCRRPTRTSGPTPRPTGATRTSTSMTRPALPGSPSPKSSGSTRPGPSPSCGSKSAVPCR